MRNKNYTKEIFYFLGLTYLLMIAGVLRSRQFDVKIFSPQNFNIISALLWILMIFSPTISAFILTLVLEGKQSFFTLLKKYVQFKEHWGWYLAGFALLLVPLLISWVVFLIGFGNGSGVESSQSFATIGALIVFTFFSGPFAEEAGWRGYALPRLQKNQSAFAASLWIGLMWTLWHVPLIFVSGADQAFFGWIGWIIYTVLIFCLSIILTWIYNNTHGSFVMVMIAHFSFNIASNLIIGLLGLVDSMTYNIIGGVSGVLYLVLIFVCFGAEKFSKKPDEELPF